MNKNKNTIPKILKKYVANAVGADPVSAQNSRGITLVALIITIIVMLLLVGVSITIALNGGLFDTTKKAAKETEEASQKEQDLASGRIKIDGTWYDSLEDYAIGKASEIQGIVDLDESNTKFKYTPEGWTNGEVKVEIASNAVSSDYFLKYSTDNTNWEEYTTGITMNENGEIHAKLVDRNGKEGGAITANVSNIDKEAPEITVALNSGGQSTTSINLSVGVKDSVSGISKIEWYYKKSTDPESEYAKSKKTDEYKTMNGKEAGEKTEVTKTKELKGLEKDTTYNIYAVVYDVAGNSTISPETGTIDVKTMASLLGRSATIDGQKYIVLYEPEEKIQIEDNEYEIKDVQLISENVLEPGNVYLGKNDGQIDWTNASVITEADLDNSTTLDDIEKSIYSYNHAIETLNKKCESLVNTSNPDIVSVRSVGTNPINPSSENTTLYISDNLSKWHNGKYNGILKSSDENYLIDYDRMNTLGITISKNVMDYWIPGRVAIGGERFSACVGFYAYRFNVVVFDPSVNIGEREISPMDWGCGVRPVVTLKSSFIANYLD